MTTEEKRFSLQLLLDSEKNDKERNILGQFSTPYSLAKDIVSYILSLPHDKNIYFLEPAIGTGVFFSALSNIVEPVKATGFEIDEHYFKPTKELWSHHNIELIHANFFDITPRAEYNLILANPPYSRHHHIDNATKKRLHALIQNEYGLNVSGLSGLYCYFLILSTRWLKADGLSCWLIPSEFLDVNYGSVIKDFLCNKVELISIHKFNPADLKFSDALVSSSIVIFRNNPPKEQIVKFTTGSDILKPTTSNEVSVCDLDPKHKWNALFGQQKADVLKGRSLGEYFKVSRGVSTGNNAFFVLSKEEAERKNIPVEFLTPILPAPRHLHINRITDDSIGLDSYRLLSCQLPLEIVKSKYPSLYDYILDGENKLMNKSYNCSRRNPWYLCERRKPAPLYMTYMGRGENASRMFRFILNETDSIVTNSYLMLYPRDKYKHCFSDKNILERIWSILNSIPKDRLARCGRTYGGGLLKIEPKELESLVIPELNGILSPLQKSLFDFEA